MSLATPDKIRSLQRKLYMKAKSEPDFRFYSLFDKVYRIDVLLHAWRLAKANDGAPGVDRVDFVAIEREGLEDWLFRLSEDLRLERYRPEPVRRVMIPKSGGGERPLGIPTIRDRVAQTAAKLVLEPIFEAGLSRNSFGYRPRRSALHAVRLVESHLRRGYVEVVDADLSQYFDTIPHGALMRSVSRRVSDSRVLALVKAWLRAPVAVRDAAGVARLTGGRRSRCGTPQGGVISPLLANIYMNRLLKYWSSTDQHRSLLAHIVSYADDFVILSKGRAVEALTWVRRVLSLLGLRLNEAKTSIKDARREPFDFLGYTFGPQRRWRDGEIYLGACPSKKSVARMRARVREVLKPSALPWPVVCRRLNQALGGWKAYFNHGTRHRAHTAIDRHVVQNVRGFLTRRHKTPTRGVRRFSYDAIFGELGVMRLIETGRASPTKAFM